MRERNQSQIPLRLRILNPPNGISPSIYPENQEENADVDKPGLAKKFAPNDHVIEAKKLNLVKFQKKTGLFVNPEAILLFRPSRLDRIQKGIELLEDIAVIENCQSTIDNKHVPSRSLPAKVVASFQTPDYVIT